MAGRSPARFLAPLALVAFVIALFVIVSSSMKSTETTSSGGGGSSGDTRPASSPAANGKKNRKGPRRYRVRTGDTPSSIAEKTGVPLEEILRLNPDLDPQTLSPGQRIKLRQ
jgi:LysM repeat protein